MDARQPGVIVAHDVDGRQVLQALDASGSAPPRTIAAGLDIDWVVLRPPSGDEMLVRGTVDGQFGLYRMNLDGSDIQLLVPATIAGDERFGDNQDLNFPAYSPDGTRIYFNRASPGRGDDPGVGDERGRLPPAPVQPVGARPAARGKARWPLHRTARRC